MEKLETHEERFTARVTIGSPEQCWLWEGAIIPHTGYAQFWPYGRVGGKVYAHRYAYERWIGPIPEGLTLDHLCHTNDLTCPGGPGCPHRRCVNPWHLEAVTHEVNVRRGARWTQLDDGSWLCMAGHPIDEAVLARRHTCPQCFLEYKREWRAKNGTEKPTEGARQREHAKRRQRRHAEFLAAHPDMEAQVDRLGLKACAVRLGHGWTFENGEWIRP